MVTATRCNPQLWEKAKQRACTSGNLCKHSARKMQWATRWYKNNGGTYKTKKPAADNSLRQWSREKWRTQDGGKSAGKKRYLPAKAWKALTPEQARRTNAAKRRGHKAGKQYVAQPADVRRTIRRSKTKSKSKSESSKRVRLSVSRTPRAAKAFKAVFTLPNGRTRTVRFGTERNYVLTPEKTAQDRNAYIARHSAPKSGEDHDDPMTAGALSRHILWGASRSWKTNVAAFKRRFKLD